MKQLAVDALKHRYEGQKKSAEYVIKNYFSHPAAIGEHPDLLAEIDKALKDWDEANGKLEALENFEDDKYETLFD
jgi:3-methyladenine DNA glycosylase/8-oxoguanine DNA glycosylase